MRIRLTAALLAAIVCAISAAAEKKKAENSEETTPPPAAQSITVAQAVQELPPEIAPRPAEYLEQRPQYFPAETVVPPMPRAACPAECPALTKAPEKPVIKVYMVADLVVPPPMAGTCAGQLAQPPCTCETQLMQKITAAVEPKSWTKAGGKGSIDYFPLGMALVVNQAPSVQAKIEEFLEKLRKDQDQQVVVETRFITVSDKWFAKSGLANELRPALDCQSPRTFLSATGVERLLQSCQADDRTNVMAAPKLTCLTGQSGRIRVGEVEHFVTGLTIGYENGQLTCTPKNVAHQLGLDVTLQPTVSADGKSVGLLIAGSIREHGVIPVPTKSVTTLLGDLPAGVQAGGPEPLTQQIQEPKIITRSFGGKLTIPDGGSALLYGGKATIEETKTDPSPVVSDIPHLAELFHNVRRQTSTNHVLVLVTTRVLSPDLVTAGCCVDSPRVDPRLGKLLADYTQACKSGKVEDARRLAIECLAIDPMCFAKK